MLPMHRELLTHLPVILALARCGGFAVRRSSWAWAPWRSPTPRGWWKAPLGTPIIARTTRVALTEAGAALVASLAPAFATIEEALEEFAARCGQVAGILSLNAPSVAPPLPLTPILAELAPPPRTGGEGGDRQCSDRYRGRRL